MTTENEAAKYEQNPIEQHQRWVVEFAAARKALEKWHERGDEIDKEFRNEMLSGAAVSDFDTRLPLFAADVLTMIAMLYGQVPRSSVSRRFGDSDDDRGRVAGEILERTLNTDISRDSDTYTQAIQCVLMDYFLPGFGQARCRYVTGEIVSKPVLGPDGQALLDEAGQPVTEESRPKEDVEVDYIHWKDWLWGPSKVLHTVPWWSHCVEMTRAQLKARFGKLGAIVPLAGKKQDGSEDPWSRAKVHEIYEKDTKRVYWFCESFTQILDTKEDPLKLEGFYPFPSAPLVSGLTNSKVVPRPYYALHQDQYRQINVLMSRIREQVEAIRTSGICSKENWEHIQRILTPEGRGKLIPVPDFNALAEKGGLRGAIDWFPLEATIQTITVLQGQLSAEIDLLHQTTGFSDIMRGEATQAGATATEQRVKAKSGSVRVQRLQDEIARYATDLLKIKAEIVCKHFSPETIKARANVQFMPEADQILADEAIALLKDRYSCYRIEVKPEAVALADFAQMKAERTEFLTTLSSYFQMVDGITARLPDAMEELLEFGKWAAAGIRGSSQIEGVFDRMVAKAKAAAEQRKNNPQPPQPNPEQMKLQAVQAKAQADMQREQLKQQGDLQRINAEVQADAMREENQRTQNVQEHAQKQMISNALKPPAPVRPGRPGGFP